jgi:hypothetical protein
MQLIKTLCILLMRNWSPPFIKTFQHKKEKEKEKEKGCHAT